MKRLRNIFFYVLTIGAFSALIYWLSQTGKKLEAGRKVFTASSHDSQWSEFTHNLSTNLSQPLAVLLAQVLTIILVARLFGWICRQINQPTVVGEIIAGIVLGPSLVGKYFPEISAALFPPQSLGNLDFLSQIGLVLFMFIIGMEVDLKVLRTRAHEAVVVSHASIIIPFALGMGLSCFIYPSLAPQGVSFLSFGLFMGIAMSITAFPVLARIVQERGIQKTRLGTMVITCAAADDITAWCLLAAVIAVAKSGGSLETLLYVITLAGAYVFVMMKVVRPFLRRVGNLHATREYLTKPIVAIFFITLLLSSYATQVIGIHALFGAFMAGVIMPDNTKFRNLFIEKIEDVALVLLLPLFFVFTGLRTEIGLLNQPYLWEVTGVIILVAMAGKFIGSAAAAKFVGQNWRDSLVIGALMNTRGLVELVVLNIGYDLGILPPGIFTMLVIMALVTTIMTGPALDLIGKIFRKRPEVASGETSHLAKYKILISFGHPDTGKSLLRIASSLVNSAGDQTVITAMHLSPSDELHRYNVEEYEKESFAPIIEASESLGRRITTQFKVSGDIDNDLLEAANRGDYDLLLVGIGQSIFEETLLGRILGFTTRIVQKDQLLQKITRRERFFENAPFGERIRLILARSQVTVGVLIDKGYHGSERVFMPVFSERDIFLVEYARMLIHHSASQVTVLDLAGQVKDTPRLKESIRSIEQIAPNHITLLQKRTIDREFLSGQGLMLVSMASWTRLVHSKSLWLSDIPSTLVMAPKGKSD